jgi:hypothetical protein
MEETVHQLRGELSPGLCLNTITEYHTPSQFHLHIGARRSASSTLIEVHVDLQLQIPNSNPHQNRYQSQNFLIIVLRLLLD